MNDILKKKSTIGLKLDDTKTPKVTRLQANDFLSTARTDKNSTVPGLESVLVVKNLLINGNFFVGNTIFKTKVTTLGQS